MKIKVVQEKCQGHNRCFAVAPDLFELDDLGYSHELNQGTVAPGQKEKALLAVKNCPEQAIVVVEED